MRHHVSHDRQLDGAVMGMGHYTEISCCNEVDYRSRDSEVAWLLGRQSGRPFAISRVAMDLSLLDKLIADKSRLPNSVALNDTRDLCGYVGSMIID